MYLRWVGKSLDSYLQSSHRFCLLLGLNIFNITLVLQDQVCFLPLCIPSSLLITVSLVTGAACWWYPVSPPLSFATFPCDLSGHIQTSGLFPYHYGHANDSPSRGDDAGYFRLQILGHRRVDHEYRLRA